MWSILIVLIIGMVIGMKITPTDTTKTWIGRFQFLGVMILLFAMGAGLGLNKELLSNLKNIGLEATAFGILTSLFSIIFVYLFSKALIRRIK